MIYIFLFIIKTKRANLIFFKVGNIHVRNWCFLKFARDTSSNIRCICCTVNVQIVASHTNMVCLFIRVGLCCQYDPISIQPPRRVEMAVIGLVFVTMSRLCIVSPGCILTDMSIYHSPFGPSTQLLTVKNYFHMNYCFILMCFMFCSLYCHFRFHFLFRLRRFIVSLIPNYN